MAIYVLQILLIKIIKKISQGSIIKLILMLIIKMINSLIKNLMEIKINGLKSNNE